MESENHYSVYMHRNKDNGKVYIGITGRSPEIRWGNNGSHYFGSGYLGRAIRKYGWDSFEHFVLHTGLSRDEANQYEKDLIARYRSNEYQFGYNIQSGGYSPGEMCEDTKRKIGLANSSHTPVLQYDRNTGEFLNWFSDLGEAQEVLGIDRNEICAICNARAKSIFGYIFRYESDRFQDGKDLPADEFEKCKNSHFRAIKQYDRDGNFIKEYPSIVDAEDALGKKHGSTLIWHCANHKKPSALGYLWSYADEGVVIQKSKKFKPVNQYDINRNFLCTYPTVKAAVDSVGGNSSCLIKYLKGEWGDTYKGYIWEYA